jgi:protoporphyrinogen/coproporphyrinogen III oxidase
MTRSTGQRKRVIVVGGGITGLAAAHRLKEQADLVVVEAGDHFGGKFDTKRFDGVTFESGPDSFVAREPHMTTLADDVGLGDQLVSPAIFGAHVWTRGELKRVPSNFVFGMPTSPWAAFRSGLLSGRGSLRTLGDLLLPGPLSGPDVSVGDFVRRRFGPEVLERLVDPLLAGTRAGRAEDISLAAALPQIDGLARNHRGLARGFAASKRTGAGVVGPPPFLAPRQGMSRLIEALIDDLSGNVDLRTSARARRIEFDADRYRLHLEGGRSVDGNAVILAVPSFVAATLLGELNPLAAAELRTIPYASVATACLIWPPGSVSLPRNVSGVLIPTGEGRTLAAATWFSQKWPHLAPADGRIVVKAFAGRAQGDAEVDLDDDRLLAALLDDLSAILPVEARPLTGYVVRWSRALPQYDVGHLHRVQRIEESLRATPGILLAGPAYRGTGISDSVKSALLASDRIERGAALP